jgi:hypothetical protein
MYKSKCNKLRHSDYIFLYCNLFARTNSYKSNKFKTAWGKLRLTFRCSAYCMYHVFQRPHASHRVHFAFRIVDVIKNDYFPINRYLTYLCKRHNVSCEVRTEFINITYTKYMDKRTRVTRFPESWERVQWEWDSGTKNNCAGEDQQHLTRPGLLVSEWPLESPPIEGEWPVVIMTLSLVEEESIFQNT